MQRISQWLCALALALPVAAASAACQEPTEPSWLPDGSEATKEDMLKGQKIIQNYMQEAQAYVDCIDKAEEAEMQKLMELEDAARKRKVEELNKKRQDRNAVVERMQTIADRFNKELDKYKARQ